MIERRALVIDVDHPERRRQRLRRLPLACLLEPESGVRADIGIARRVDDDPRGDPTEAGLGGDDDVRDPAVADRRVLDERVEEHARPAGLDQVGPRDPEMIRVVRDAGAGAVGVRTLHDRAQRSQTPDHLVGDAPDDLPRSLPGRPEAVEGVEDGGRRPAQRAVLLEEERVGAAAGRRDRRRAPRAAGAHHQDVARGQERDGHDSIPGPLQSLASATVQPPSTARTCPVTARLSSDRR